MSIQEFFLGCSSPTGFRSSFIDTIKKDGFYTYILKGGPGTGKSTLMKKIAKKFENDNITLYRCSSDINSLDAVVNHTRKFIFVDGTAPHVFDPIYPGVNQEIINLGKFWDKSKLLKNTEKIKKATDINQKHHKTVRHYIEAISSINTDIYQNTENSLDKSKLSAYIERLSKKLIPKKENNLHGKIEFSQLSALTSENYKTLNIIGDYSGYFINDDNFAGGDYFLRRLADMFISSGYDVIISKCVLLNNETFEHLICPKLHLKFITGNFLNKLNAENDNIINFARFYDKNTLNIKKNRISFNKKAASELTAEAAKTLSIALDSHDEIEKFYIDAIDFQKLNEETEKIINTL